MAALPRILAIAPASTPLPFSLPEGAEVIRRPDWAAAQDLVKQGAWDGIWIASPNLAPMSPTDTFVARQAKIDALYRAGLELAALEPEKLGSLCSEDRVNRLKTNILQQTKSLLGYDRIDIRLLKPGTNVLEPLVSEGMDPEAAQLRLTAQKEGSGTSGRVAVTGESYYCPNTAVDPLYIQGASSTQSSLTVPLVHQDKLIGVMTIESPLRDGFSHADRQMLELFGREIGAALHTLRLLSAERHGAASESVEAIRAEVALPVDSILNAAASLLDRYIGLDPEMTEKLQQIRGQARGIKDCILRAGEALVPTSDSKVRPRDLPLKGIRVLVADADDLVLRGAHKTLARLGCEVETVHTAKEAFVMARHTPYDFALVDLKLPDSMGYDTFRGLKEADPNIQVALMSSYGYDPTHSIVRAKQEGLAGALYKPFRVDQLLDVLLRPPTKPPAPEPMPA